MMSFSNMTDDILIVPTLDGRVPPSGECSSILSASECKEGGGENPVQI